MPPVAEAGDRVLEVSVESGRLSVRAEQARLAEVLEAVGRHAGFEVVLTGDLDTRVTETLIDVPVEEGLRRLTRWDSVVLIYGEVAGREVVMAYRELGVIEIREVLRRFCLGERLRATARGTRRSGF